MFREDISTGDRDVGCLEKILAQVSGKIMGVFSEDISRHGWLHAIFYAGDWEKE